MPNVNFERKVFIISAMISLELLKVILPNLNIFVQYTCHSKIRTVGLGWIVTLISSWFSAVIFQQGNKLWPIQPWSCNNFIINYQAVIIMLTPTSNLKYFHDSISINSLTKRFWFQFTLQSTLAIEHWKNIFQDNFSPSTVVL